jgi:hypothetical protein
MTAARTQRFHFRVFEGDGDMVPRFNKKNVLSTRSRAALCANCEDAYLRVSPICDHPTASEPSA